MNILISIINIVVLMLLSFNACNAEDLYPVRSMINGTIVLGGATLDGEIARNFDFDRKCYTKCFCVEKKWLKINDWHHDPLHRKSYIYDNLAEVVLPEREEDNQFYVSKGDIIGYTNEENYKPPTIINDCDKNTIQR